MVIFSTEAQKGVLLHKDSDTEVEETDAYEIKSQQLNDPDLTHRSTRTIDIRLLPQMGGDV